MFKYRVDSAREVGDTPPNGSFLANSEVGVTLFGVNGVLGVPTLSGFEL